MIYNIASWNVNGLKSIENKQGLSWIYRHKPDILCLQETKLSSENKINLGKLCNHQYTHYSFNKSTFKKGFSGTAIFSNFAPFHTNYCHHIDQEFDGRIIEHRYNQLVILNIYVPNGKLNSIRFHTKLSFFQNLVNYCQNLIDEGYAVIICGDFNTAHKDLDLKQDNIKNRSGFSDLEREYINTLISFGFIDTYRYIHGDKKDAYTLFPYRSKAREKNEGWRVDYIFISSSLKNNLQDAYILKDVLGSDHVPLGIKINLDNYL